MISPNSVDPCQVAEVKGRHEWLVPYTYLCSEGYSQNICWLRFKQHMIDGPTDKYTVFGFHAI